ncbi:MBL fold metallo-hydrolase [Microlunatus sp. GCM10028923]|uniref:MBL fold metallo-hydrolase n=1 Tax=Microlunatus sp. GCM10028923 TaxID=3273400 RepID=UPI00361B20CB
MNSETTTDGAPRLTVFGCRAGMPEPGWPSSGYLVQLDGGAILLDCGPGVAPKAAAISDDLSAIFISHLHVDHCLDLLTLGKSLVHRRDGRPADLGARLPLYLPAGGTAIFRRFNGLFPLGTEGPGPHPTDRVFTDVFEVREYVPGEPVTVGTATVLPVPMRHRLPCCGFRVSSNGHTLAYSADTGLTPAFDPLAGDADLLLVEATLASPGMLDHGHLSASEAGQVAARHGVRRVILTHWADTDPAWLADQAERAAQHFPGRLELAVPDHTFHL